MKKKNILLLSGSLAMAGLIGLTFAVQGKAGNPLEVLFGASEPYATTFTDGASLKSVTGNNNQINYVATSLTGGTASSIGTLAKGGTLNNTTRLGGMTKLEIVMTSGSIDIYTSWTDATFSHSAVDSLTASGTVTFNDAPNFYKIVARADTVLTSVKATYACSAGATDPFTGNAITTVAELTALDNATGHYYLANDIDLTSVLGNPVVTDFAGVLDGMGHKLYATKHFRDNADGGVFAASNTGKGLVGAVRNMRVEINPDTVTGYYQNSPFAYKIDTGAFIKDVVIVTAYGGAAQSAGVLCCYLNGGTIKDTNIYLSTPTYNTQNDKVGVLGYRMSQGVVLQDVKTLCPAEVPMTGLAAYYSLDGSFTPDLSGFSVVHDGSARLLENPLFAPVSSTGAATTTANTWNGMPYYTTNLTGAVWTALNNTFDLRNYDHVRLWVRSAKDVSMTGDDAIHAGANEWVRLDVTRSSGDTFTVVGCRGGNGYMTKTGITDHTLGDMLGFLDWSGSTSYAFDATPLYMVEEASNKIAKSAFADAVAVTDRAYTSKTGLTGGSWGQNCFDSTDISSYTTVRFSIWFDDQSDHAAHGVSVHNKDNPADSSGTDITINSGVWGSYTLTQASGTWSLSIVWYSSDASGKATSTLSSLTGTSLSALLSFNSWHNNVGYSTPVFAA